MISATLLRRSRHALLAAIRRRPALFFPLMRWRLPHYPVVLRDSELVVEGFWRCGNTFAVRAIQSAQPRHVRMAYHTHAAASVLRSVAWKTPTLVLIRRPDDAAASLVLKHAERTLRQVLREYASFYEAIEPFSDRFVTATFDQVTHDLGAVIRRVNEHFDRNFEVFRHTPSSAALVLDEIAQQDARLTDGDRLGYCTPRPEKQAAKQDVLNELHSGRYARLLYRANACWRRYQILAANSPSFPAAA